jgi:hypothetical protein
MAVELQYYRGQVSIVTKIELFFDLLFGPYMRDYPKRSAERSYKGNKTYDRDRQWVFVGSKESMISVATKSTLYAVLADPAVDTTYFTPNGYYHRNKRLTEALRWLNAFVLDLDVHGESFQDVLDRIDRAGLPRPTAIVKTPSGGYHVHFFFRDPIRATKKTVRLYTAIMGHIANDLGGDLAAVGANRIFRTPTDNTLVYFEPLNRYSFEVFKEWREINHPFMPAGGRFVNIRADELMNHPALQRLLTMPCSFGHRDIVAFNLALAMKASGWSQNRAEAVLRHWYHHYCAKGAPAGKKPFSQRDAVYKVQYVYRNSRLQAPKAEIIRRLTGVHFAYQTRVIGDSAKPRSERDRSHLIEWENDLMSLLCAEKILSGTQQELADRLGGCPIASFKLVLRRLKEAGRIVVESKRGRGGVTILRLPEAPESPIKQDKLQCERKCSQETHIETHVVIYADFRQRRVMRIERVASYEQLQVEDPDPDPPD